MGREKRSPRRTNEANWAAAKAALISIYSMKDGSLLKQEKKLLQDSIMPTLLPTPFLQTLGHLKSLRAHR